MSMPCVSSVPGSCICEQLSKMNPSIVEFASSSREVTAEKCTICMVWQVSRSFLT